MHEGHEDFEEKIRSDEEGDEESAFAVQVGDEKEDGEDGELDLEWVCVDYGDRDGGPHHCGRRRQRCTRVEASRGKLIM